MHLRSSAAQSMYPELQHSAASHPHIHLNPGTQHEGGTCHKGTQQAPIHTRTSLGHAGRCCASVHSMSPSSSQRQQQPPISPWRQHATTYPAHLATSRTQPTMPQSNDTQIASSQLPKGNASTPRRLLSRHMQGTLCWCTHSKATTQAPATPTTSHAHGLQHLRRGSTSRTQGPVGSRGC